ncbi:hypothetical protein D9619_003078 [Psilocybe cf. subviscida]|uniref:Micro-fibrillar-associated protein 1 C-terminal domain-containing protein n=1 Tax=Psilocybe cf. subviscida TaxID=2480587 RepID=A0A8H5AVM9_9AGAR|nr:hypothetical protein D9619_003078 [Psilocybe cf. subviscida]
MSSSKKQAPRLARPAVRYWKGKAPKGIAEAESDSDAEEEEQPYLDEGDVPMDEEEVDGLEIRQQSKAAAPKALNIALRDVEVSKEGKVIVAGREESGRTLEEEDEDEDDEEEEESEEEETKPATGADEEDEESSEYESESEEEKVEFRPVFVPKRARVTIAERDSIAHDTEDALRKKELEAEERRKQSHDLVAESIRRELAEKEKEEEFPDVDDTDGLDPAEEFEAWRLRELGRIKKEKEEEVAREKEREEIERRRAMPEEQRMKEDLERAQKLREEKPKGSQKFLQKYWHKGAFHQDEEILKRHDFTEATESTVDVSMLPKVMQVKNFGKRSRTKYTHLVDQDTTIDKGGFGGASNPKDQAGCFLCGGPHLKKDREMLVAAFPDLDMMTMEIGVALGKIEMTDSGDPGRNPTAGIKGGPMTKIEMTIHREHPNRITTDMAVAHTREIGRLIEIDETRGGVVCLFFTFEIVAPFNRPDKEKVLPDLGVIPWELHGRHE